MPPVSQPQPPVQVFVSRVVVVVVVSRVLQWTPNPIELKWYLHQELALAWAMPEVGPGRVEQVLLSRPLCLARPIRHLNVFRLDSIQFNLI